MRKSIVIKLISTWASDDNMDYWAEVSLKTNKRNNTGK